MFVVEYTFEKKFCEIYQNGFIYWRRVLKDLIRTGQAIINKVKIYVKYIES